MHIGSTQQAGGRAGEAAPTNLSASLKEVGLELGRLKTGTPPRLLRRSIDFSKTEVQPGDEPVPYFTFWNDDLFHVEQSPSRNTGMFHVEQIDQTPRVPAETRQQYPPGSILSKIGGQLPCYITYTTEETANIIQKNLH